MNVYSELLELLTPERKLHTGRSRNDQVALDVRMYLAAEIDRGTALTEGLYYLQGTVFREEDIGKELALLSCEEGFWILGFVGGGGA